MPALSTLPSRLVRGIGIAAVAVPVVVLFAIVASRERDDGNGQAGGPRSNARSTPVTVAYLDVGAGRNMGGRFIWEGAAPPKAPEFAAPFEETRAGGGTRFSHPLLAWTAILDGFGSPRGPERVHGGIDIGVRGLGQMGVMAACPGTVVSTGIDDEYGLHILIDCGDDLSTLYAYLGEAHAKPGEAISAGAMIGVTHAQGGYLHFEIRFSNVPLDPAEFLDFTPPPRPGNAALTPTAPATSRPRSGSGAPATSAATATQARTATPTRPPATPTPVAVAPSPTRPLPTPVATPKSDH